MVVFSSIPRAALVSMEPIGNGIKLRSEICVLTRMVRRAPGGGGRDMFVLRSVECLRAALLVVMTAVA